MCGKVRKGKNDIFPFPEYFWGHIKMYSDLSIFRAKKHSKVLLKTPNANTSDCNGKNTPNTQE